LARPFKTNDMIAPGATPEAVLKAARWPDASEPVLVIGHQPTLGMVAALLLAGTPQPWAVRKGAAWWLRSRDREGTAQVVLHAVMSTDCL
jgi:phosphohistidine phosphatase